MALFDVVFFAGFIWVGCVSILGELGGGCRSLGLRKLHPPSRAATLRGVRGDPWQWTETIPPMVCDDSLGDEVALGLGETTNPQGARANRRRYLPTGGAGSLHS